MTMELLAAHLYIYAAASKGFHAALLKCCFSESQIAQPRNEHHGSQKMSERERDRRQMLYSWNPRSWLQSYNSNKSKDRSSVSTEVCQYLLTLEWPSISPHTAAEGDSLMYMYYVYVHTKYKVYFLHPVNFWNASHANISRMTYSVYWWSTGDHAVGTEEPPEENMHCLASSVSHPTFKVLLFCPECTNTVNTHIISNNSWISLMQAEIAGRKVFAAHCRVSARLP